MVKWPRLASATQLCGFFGLTGFWFVTKYARVPIAFEEKRLQAELAFENLKLAMTRMLMLTLLDFSQSFMVEIDASNRGIGAVFTQNGHILAYFSKKSNKRITIASAIACCDSSNSKMVILFIWA